MTETEESEESPSRHSNRRLPSQPHSSAFVGRNRELEALRDRLTETDGFVTLVGPPGVGKTRLATELGRRLYRETFEDRGGVSMISCADIRGPGELVRRVADVCSLTDAIHSDIDIAIDRVGQRLAARSQLTILDNLEQATDAARRVLHSWMEHDLAGRILLTSRQPLGADGEETFELGPLETEAGVALYREVAASVGADVDRYDGELLERLAEGLEGIPLSVELAATRAPVVGPPELLERLDEQLELLAEAEDDWSAWEQTLRNAIERSWNQLSPAERAGLAQASVFEGDFDLNAAETVLEIDAYGPDLAADQFLQNALRKSLATLQSQGSTGDRFALYGAVRAFASEQLEALDERRATARRHARHFANRADRFVEELASERWEESLRLFSRDLANHRAALRWATEHEPTLAADIADAMARYDQVRPTELVDAPVFERTLERLKEEGREPTDRDRLRMEFHLFDARFHASEIPSARATSSLEELGERAQRIGDAFTLFRTKRRLIWLCRLEDRHGDALEIIEESLELADSEAHPRHRARMWVDRAREQSAMGEVEAAMESVELAERSFERVDDPFHRPELYEVRCRLELIHGDPDAAISAGERAVSLLHELGDRRRLAIMTDILATSYARKGDWERAERNVECAKEALLEHGAAYNRAAWRVDRGVVHLGRGAYERAEEEFEEARQLARSTEATSERKSSLFWLTILAARREEIEHGRTLLDRVRSVADPESRLPAFAAAELEFAESRRHLEEGDVFESLDRIMAARTRTAVTQPDSGGDDRGMELFSIDASVAREFFERAVEQFRDEYQDDFDTLEEMVRFDRHGGRWFQVGRQTPVDLRGRSALRRIVSALGEHRLRCRGEGLDKGELLAIGWPDEELSDSEHASRVYQAVSELRSKGLDDVLLSDRRGYFLDPDVPVASSDEPRS